MNSLLHITLVFALFAAFSCTDKEKKALPDLHKKRPESPVVKGIKHYLSDAGRSEMLYELEEFNKDGHRIRQVRYQGKDTLDFEAVYTPNDEGNPVKTVTKYLDGTTDTEIHTYNDEGKAVKTEWTRSDGTMGRHEYYYDEHDSMVRWDRYQGGKYIITQLWPNAYDENGRVAESWYKETNNGRDTSTQSHWQYQYDSLFGRLIHRLTLSGPALQYAEQFYYDSLHNLILVIEYGLDTTRAGTYIPQKRTINTYNEYGELLTSQTLDAGGKELERRENEYDKYGHLVKSEIITRMEDGTTQRQTHRWEYSYY